MQDLTEVCRRIEMMTPWLKEKGMAPFLDAKVFIAVAATDTAPVFERGYIFKVKLHGVDLCLVSPAGNAAPFFCFEDFRCLEVYAEIGSWLELHRLVGC